MSYAENGRAYVAKDTLITIRQRIINKGRMVRGETGCVVGINEKESECVELFEES